MSDLIRREDLVKELNAQFAVGDITREIANDILNHIPSAEPERKMGEWIYDIGRRSGKTLEFAISYLQSVGWLQEHDRILTESAEPERKTGKWIFHIDDLFPEESTQECSVCHEEESIKIQNDNFCPNCGADMRGERE